MEDLHKLWFVLEKELNMLKTKEAAKKQIADTFIDSHRVGKVRASMARLKFVVHERQLAYQKALEILDQEALEKTPASTTGAQRRQSSLSQVKTMSRVVRERIRKFRHDTWKAQNQIPPVAVNQHQHQSQSQKRL